LINIRIIDTLCPPCYTAHGMTSGTRDLIIRTLRSKGRCTVKDLAEAAGISPVSVRHHLASLQADGLIQLQEVRHGVGRPRHEFSLTEQALELFPSRYLRLTSRLLNEIKGSFSEEQVEGLLSSVADAMAADYTAQLQGLPLEERLVRLAELLDEEGFAAEIERRGEDVIIRELSCPYLHIGQEHPEVCLIGQSFIAKALSLPVERVRCLLEGDAHCAFTVQIEKAASGESHDR